MNQNFQFFWSYSFNKYTFFNKSDWLNNQYLEDKFPDNREVSELLD